MSSEVSTNRNLQNFMFCVLFSCIRISSLTSLIKDKLQVRFSFLFPSYFEIFPSPDQNLTFDYFSKKFKEHLKIDCFDVDIMKIRGLYSSEEGYNRTAHLSSDNSLYQ